MIPPLNPGVTLPLWHCPMIETKRLILRQWRASDVAPNTAMLSDPPTARFITADGKPITETFNGWRNAAIMAGHWVLNGVGMFVVEEKSSGQFVGRVGPWFPPSWPGFEIGWGLAKEFRGKGYALEAAHAAINWSFATFELDRIIHCIDRENEASKAVARRLGASIEGETTLIGHAADVWVTRRSEWGGSFTKFEPADDLH
jgi:RimJ/RimL family protein N-acetyltransferase